MTGSGSTVLVVTHDPGVIAVAAVVDGVVDGMLDGMVDLGV